MKEANAAPTTDSPPARPSTWQLRFGKKSAIHLQQNDEVDVRRSRGNQSLSPSISEQLLRAFDRKPSDQEELNRDCADILIGRRNAFANGPELRLHTLTNGPESDELNEYDQENVAKEAKEIIRARFEIETQASMLRHAPKHRNALKHRMQAERRSRIRPSAGLATSNNTIYSKSAALNHSAVRYHEEKESHVGSVQSVSNNQNIEARIPKNESQKRQLKPKQRRHVGASGTGLSSTKALVRQLPPRQLPMERRHQQLEQARMARKMRSAEEDAIRKIVDTTWNDTKKGESKEERRVKEQIERLTLENQHVVALEERLEQRKERLKSLSQCFNAWYQCVEFKQEQEIRVAAEFNWRAMKSIMATWKRYVRCKKQMKVAEHTRLILGQEQKAKEQAIRFHRSKCLPALFYRWTVFVAQQKDHRAAEEAAERRRTQTEKLMERLQRQKESAEDERHNRDQQKYAEGDFGTEEDDIPQEVAVAYVPRQSRDHTTSWINTTTSVKVQQGSRRRHAWSGAEEYRTAPLSSNERAASTALSIQTSSPQFPEAVSMRAPKRVDKAYLAMEQRAVERKQRREELRRRYDELEQKKRKEIEDQRAAREEQLHQQRIEERARIRERKLAEALALQEKQELRDHMISQHHKAKKHNRRRLLFHYALVPWLRHHALNERVAFNARRWHELRVVFSHWEQWQKFVRMRRKVHRRWERVQLEKAARHHARILQHRALRGLVRFHQATEARAVAVRRQNERSALHRLWAHWHKRLRDERSYQRQIVYVAKAKLQKLMLHRICTQWRKVTCEIKIEHELEHEKQEIWRKVRGWLDEEA